MTGVHDDKCRCGDCIERAVDALIAKGMVEDCGRDEKGDIIYRLTKKGEKYADEQIARLGQNS